MTSPLWSRLLAPGVFKPSCSTPFTLFLRLVSVYWPFQLYFIPKTLHNTSVFSSLLTAYFYLTSHSLVFIYNTALLYIILLTLCGHLQTQRVCCALHPVSGEDGILVAKVRVDGVLVDVEGFSHPRREKPAPRGLVNRDKDLIATTDAHLRPVRVHAQRPGNGLQAKSVCPRLSHTKAGSKQK